jgi:hypothetical protein
MVFHFVKVQFTAPKNFRKQGHQFVVGIDAPDDVLEVRDVLLETVAGRKRADSESNGRHDCH